MTSRVDRRDRITIDRAAREALGVAPGMLAYQRVVAGRLEVLFLPGPHRRSLYGALHREGEPPRVLTGDQLEEAVMEAIAAEQEEGEQD